MYASHDGWRELEIWLLMIQDRNAWSLDMEAFARELACILGA